MSHRIAYFRVSTTDQSIEAQRHALLQDAGACPSTRNSAMRA